MRINFRTAQTSFFVLACAGLFSVVTSPARGETGEGKEAGNSGGEKEAVSSTGKKDKAEVKEAAQELASRLPYVRKLVGEKTVYDGYVFKAGIRVHVGQARFFVEDKGGKEPPDIQLRAVAEGGKFGYTLRAESKSILEADSYKPTVNSFSHTGSERRFKKLLFREGKVLYVKKKHCHDPNCRNPDHMIKRVKWAGPVPVGTEVVHCPDCDNLKHYVWKVRHTHEVKQCFLDMLTALYVARADDFEVGSSFVVPVVEDRDRWFVTVSVLKEESMKVEAGAFDCVKIALTPKNAVDPEEKPRFKGLFGIKGSINIWIDKKTRIPVRILGTIPFAFIDLHCEVCLREIKQLGREKKESGEEKLAKADR